MYAEYARRPFSLWRYKPLLLFLKLGQYGLLLLLLTLGLASKSMLVTVPAVLLLLDYWPLQRFAPWGAGAASHDAAGAAPLSLEQVLMGQATPLWFILLEKVPLFALSFIDTAILLFAQRENISSITAKTPYSLTRISPTHWCVTWPI